MRNETISGLIIGLCTPFIAYFIFSGLNSLLVHWYHDEISGFSLRFICILSLLANTLPLRFLYARKRYEAARIVMIITVIGAFGILFYFRDGFFS
ncbi:MAG: hypothetical protein R2798_01135 [Chitinophagales bacterium]|nr:hypothetical protein [Bacteroidota bacterium]MCB9042993.1 hypothetical protein [Chitinophagales bacterium]